jgi:hypothetical protein
MLLRHKPVRDCEREDYCDQDQRRQCESPADETTIIGYANVRTSLLLKCMHVAGAPWLCDIGLTNKLDLHLEFGLHGAVEIAKVLLRHVSVAEKVSGTQSTIASRETVQTSKGAGQARQAMEALQSLLLCTTHKRSSKSVSHSHVQQTLRIPFSLRLYCIAKSSNVGSNTTVSG